MKSIPAKSKIEPIELIAQCNYGLASLMSKQIRSLGGKINTVVDVKANQFVFFEIQIKNLNINKFTIAEDIYINVFTVSLFKQKDLAKIDSRLEKTDLRNLISKYKLLNGYSGDIEKSYQVFIKQDKDHYLYRREIASYLTKAISKRSRSWKVNGNKYNYEFVCLYKDNILTTMLRLTDSSFKYHNRKPSKQLSSLRPNVASAVVSLVSDNNLDSIVDPCAGSGTLVQEIIQLISYSKIDKAKLIANDKSLSQYLYMRKNLKKGNSSGIDLQILRHDCSNLPLTTSSIGAVVSNLPWGEQRSDIVAIQDEYAIWIDKWHKALRDSGQLIVLVKDSDLFKKLAVKNKFKLIDDFKLNILGQRANILGFKK